MPNPKRQDPREIIAEVQQLGGEIEQRLARVFALSDALYSSVRHGHFRQERERLDIDLRLLQARLDRATDRGDPAELLLQLQNAAHEIERQIEAHGEIVPAYMLFANGWKRLAGTMHQGLRRTASVNRVVEQMQRKHGLMDVAAAHQPAPPPATTQRANIEDLVELYGEEVVNDASQR